MCSWKWQPASVPIYILNGGDGRKGEGKKKKRRKKTMETVEGKKKSPQRDLIQITTILHKPSGKAFVFIPLT